jgi:hypothetical protein
LSLSLGPSVGAWDEEGLSRVRRCGVDGRSRLEMGGSRSGSRWSFTTCWSLALWTSSRVARLLGGWIVRIDDRRVASLNRLRRGIFIVHRLVDRVAEGLGRAGLSDRDRLGDRSRHGEGDVLRLGHDVGLGDDVGVGDGHDVVIRDCRWLRCGRRLSWVLIGKRGSRWRGRVVTRRWRIWIWVRVRVRVGIRRPPRRQVGRIAATSSRSSAVASICSSSGGAPSASTTTRAASSSRRVVSIWR